MNNVETPRGRSPWWWVPSLYFAEGLPYMAVMTISTVMYKCLGIGNTELAFYTAWLYLPWVIKPFWSPFVDILRTKRWWVVAMQWTIAAAMAGIAFALPAQGFFQLTLCVFWLMAFASATHDIAADGFYMLGLSEHQQSYFVGIRNISYKLATVAAFAGGTGLCGWLIKEGVSVKMSWTIVISIIAILFLGFSIYHKFILPQPEADHGEPDHSASQIIKEFSATFVSFFQKPGIGLALVFMLLYRLPESLLTKMISPFLLDPMADGGLGLSNEQVGITYGIIGTIGLLGGGLLGGFLISKGGLRYWIRPMAWSMSITCLTFVLLSHAESPAMWMVDSCVFIEQFGYGFGFSAYMLFLIYFSEGKYATAHYAICTGFMALGLMLPGMAAGWLQELLGYQNFFLLTIVSCITTIVVATIVKIDPSFGRKNK